MPAISSTLPGTIDFVCEGDGRYFGYCRYQLLTPFDAADGRAKLEMASRHAAEIGVLAMRLGILLGSPTHGMFLEYHTVGGSVFSGPAPELPDVLWDWNGFPCDLAPEAVEQVLKLGVADSPVLRLLYTAATITNPVARYLCVWQALAYHCGTDSPARLDSVFFDRIGIPRGRGPRGPESRFAQLRNTLSHPRDRDMQSYEGLDSPARELADELAALVLHDVDHS